jgi:hypothetical protein
LRENPEETSVLKSDFLQLAISENGRFSSAYGKSAKTEVDILFRLFITES